MKLSSVWESYVHYTRDVTDFSRRLGFGGAALCWIFKESDNSFPCLVTVALIAIVVYFILDILQSFASALVYRVWLHKKEAKHWKEDKSIDVEIEKPRWMDYPAFTLFVLKTVALLTGFVLIGLFLLK